jgi:hypothetical protein
MLQKLTLVLLIAVLLPAAALAKGGQPKQDICHLDKDSGTFEIISVAAPAVPAHLAHGDHFPLTFWADNDGDGFGAGPAVVGCVVPPGYVENDDDCDDTDPAVYPGATEVCNGVDDDCDGDVDEGLTFDDDGDGYTSIDSCEGSADDCDDADPAVNPGATETCNGIDDDCDTEIDEGLTFDDDGDGYTSTDSCEGSTDDCDDTDPAVNPGATEACNGIDDDCDGSIDEGGVCAEKVVFLSSQLFDGNFGNGQEVLGHLAADQRCQDLADAASLGGTFKAWISGRVDTGDGPLPHGVVDRFTQNPGPYVLVNGTKVADDWADLTDGSLDHAIDRTEANLPLADGAEARVWTNTTTSGLAWDNSTNCALGPSPDNAPGIHTWSCGSPVGSPGDCVNQSGKFGLATSTTGSWTGATSSNINCTNTFHLYCFEQ